MKVLKMVKKPDETTTEAKLEEAFQIKLEIKRLEKKLKELNADIVNFAEFKKDASTGYVVADGYRAKVVKGVTLKVNQEKIENCVDLKAFDLVFSYEAKIKSKKVFDSVCEVDPEFKEAMKEAIEVKEKKPSVTVEETE